MKFSIFSIILLTFWIALGVQTYSLWQRHIQMVVERRKSEVQSQSLRAELASWQQRQVDQSAADGRRELERLERIDRELVKAFEAETPALSALEPAGEMVSVRSIPILGRYKHLHHKVKVYVPQTRKVALEIDVRKRNRGAPTEAGDGPSRQSVGFSPELKGEHPISVELMAGIRIVECLFDYRDDVAEPYFTTLVDGNEISRFTCPDVSGYSSSQPNWLKQQDIRSNRELPDLLELAPGSRDAEIIVRLVDLE